MRALVTGGAGFLGSHLVDRLLAEGHEVDVIDDLSTGKLGNLADARADRSRRFTFHQLDIRAPELVDVLTHRAPEVVFHLAAQASVSVSVAQPAFDADVNVLGSLNIFQAAVVAGVRKVVFASSGGAIYGSLEEIPVREGHPQRPLSPYGVAKKAVGDYLYYYREIQGLEFSAIAPANIYGPRQDPHGEAGVVAIFAERLLAMERPTIYGNGDQTRDFVFVDDVVDAFVRAADRGNGLILNVGTGVETTIQQLYDTMARLAGFDEPASYAPARAGDVLRSAVDPGRAEIHLGWKPFTSLEDGLARTLDAMRTA